MTVLRLRPAAASHKGMRRRDNEDALGFEYPSNPDVLQSHGALFIVADGVGGLSAGDKASQMTVEQLIKHYYASDAVLSVEQRLAEAIQAVNSNIYSTFNRSGATTIVAVVIIGDQLIAASAGDSQIFRIVDNTIEQLNVEDVLHSDDADDGALTKAIGYRETIEIETISGALKPDDKILLCSDGLTRYLKNPQILQLSQLRDPRDSVRRMINNANSAGGADNISVLLIHVGEAIQVEDIANYLNSFSVWVAVDTDAQMMQDVPSKPTTQIPQSRPETVIDEALLGTADLPKHDPKPIATPKAPQETSTSETNGLTIIIIAAVAILAIGAVIFGIALASLNHPSATAATENIEDHSVTNSDTTIIENTEESFINNIQIGDLLLFDEAVLTKNSIGSEIGAFLASANIPYLVNNITEDSEGQLWYLLLEDETNQRGWLAESDLPAYIIQRD